MPRMTTMLAASLVLPLVACQPGPNAPASSNNSTNAAGLTTLREGNGPSAIDISTYAGQNLLVYGNGVSNTVVVANLDSKTVLKKLSVGSTPTDMALRADGKVAFITCKGSEQVAIVDLSALTVQLVKVGRKLIEPDSASASSPVHIYAVDAPADAADYTSDNVQAFVTKTFVPVGTKPHGLAFAGGMVINDNPTSGDTNFIDPTGETVASTLSYSDESAKAPIYVKATHDGEYALSLDGSAKAVRVLKGASQSQLYKVDLQGATPGSKLVWYDDTTAIVPLKDASSKANVMRLSWTNGFETPPSVERLTINSDTATDSVGGFAAAGGGYLAVPHAGDNSVSFLKVGTAPTVAHPGDPNRKQQIWVGGDGDQTVTVLDAQTFKVVGVVKVGDGHHKMAFTSTKAFVSNINANTVSVIDRTLIK